MPYRTAAFLALAALATAGGCGDAPTPDGGDPEASGIPVIATTFYPTTYFAQRLVGDKAKVVCPCPADADPIFWMPRDEDIAVYQGADLIVVNGAGFEKWVEKVSLPPSKVVDTAASFSDEFLQFEHASTHTHGPAGEHTHSGLDGHTWLDPVHAIAQAKAICEALVKLRPADAALFRENHAALNTALSGFDTDLKALVKDYSGHFIYASHPAYNYLAKRYGLKIVNLDLDPETMPDEATFEAIRASLETKPAKHILWESEPTDAIAARFRELLGLESVTFSPCETMDPKALAEGEDYLAVMRRNVEALRPVLTRK